MNPNPLTLVSLTLQEIMACCAIPGSAVVGHVFADYQKRREQIGLEILIKRIADAEIDTIEAADKNELIGVLYSYAQSVRKGTAQINLDLLSQAIAGEMKRDNLYPDRFHKYINILESLTQDEILVIGTYLRCYKQSHAEAEKRNELYLGAITPNTWTKLQSELVPSAFPTQEHVSVICGSLIRTGLTTAEAPKLGHSPSHSFTILLNEIADLINFEQAYRQYPNY